MLSRRSRARWRWRSRRCCCVIEELRGSGELGFPWFQPGYTQHAYAPLLQLASLGSVTLVTLWLLLAQRAGLARGRAASRGARAAAGRGAAAGAALGCGGARTLQAAPHRAGPGAWRWSRATSRARSSGRASTRRRSSTRSSRSTEPRRRARGPRSSIWPETATGSYLRRQPDQALAVARLRASRPACRCSPASRTTIYGPDGRPRTYNAAGLFLPDGTLGPRYAKRHLVPFGERMPFQWLLPALGRIESRPGRVDAGRRAGAVRRARPDASRAWSASSRSSPTWRAKRRARAARAGSSTSPTTSGSATARRSTSTPRWRCSARSRTTCRWRAAPTPDSRC